MVLTAAMQLKDRVGGMPWSKRWASNYNAQLGLPDKCWSIKEFVSVGCYFF